MGKQSKTFLRKLYNILSDKDQKAGESLKGVNIPEEMILIEQKKSKLPLAMRRLVIAKHAQLKSKQEKKENV